MFVFFSTLAFVRGCLPIIAVSVFFFLESVNSDEGGQHNGLGSRARERKTISEAAWHVSEIINFFNVFLMPSQ